MNKNHWQKIKYLQRLTALDLSEHGQFCLLHSQIGLRLLDEQIPLVQLLAIQFLVHQLENLKLEKKIGMKHFTLS